MTHFGLRKLWKRFTEKHQAFYGARVVFVQGHFIRKNLQTQTKICQVLTSYVMIVAFCMCENFPYVIVNIYIFIYCRTRRFGQAYCFKDRRSLRGITKSSKKVKGSNNNILSDKDLSHIMWWQEVKCFFMYFHQQALILLLNFFFKNKFSCVICYYIARLM